MTDSPASTPFLTVLDDPGLASKDLYHFRPFSVL